MSLMKDGSNNSVLSTYNHQSGHSNRCPFGELAE
jgi:hypothetical protein